MQNFLALLHFHVRAHFSDCTTKLEFQAWHKPDVTCTVFVDLIFDMDIICANF